MMSKELQELTAEIGLFDQDNMDQIAEVTLVCTDADRESLCVTFDGVLFGIQLTIMIDNDTFLEIAERLK